MTPRVWITTTIALFALGCGIVFGSSYAIDLFGIFRDPTGKQLTVHHNERTAKFFLNERYVPTNFDALFIGGSSTSNFRMADLDFARFYNESLYGSNTVEEKQLVDEAMRRGHYGYAIVVINPYLLQSHNFNEGSGVPPRREAPWLSQPAARRVLHCYAANKSYAIIILAGWWASDATNKKGFGDGALEFTFRYDPVALEALRQTLDELRATGTKIIFLQTGVYETTYQRYKRQFDDFYATFPLRKPGEPLIDLNRSEDTAFRNDRTRWVDPPHLTDAAAEDASIELNAAIHAALPGLAALPEWRRLKR